LAELTSGRANAVGALSRVAHVVRASIIPGNPQHSDALVALGVVEGFETRYSATQLALIILEAWNLVIIGISLVGFNYVSALASSYGHSGCCGL